MTSKHQVERSDVHALQREKERERRRLRDRQRRQNMSNEQREKHLARRRRNYQLRRIRAQNAKLLDSNQTNTNTRSTAGIEQKISISQCAAFPALELPTCSKLQDGAQRLRKYPRRLRLSAIRHLARRLHSDSQQQGDERLLMTIGSPNTTCVPAKRLRLTHVKRLARALKVTVK